MLANVITASGQLWNFGKTSFLNKYKQSTRSSKMAI